MEAHLDKRAKVDPQGGSGAPPAPASSTSAASSTAASVVTAAMQGVERAATTGGAGLQTWLRETSGPDAPSDISVRDAGTSTRTGLVEAIETLETIAEQHSQRAKARRKSVAVGVLAAGVTYLKDLEEVQEYQAAPDAVDILVIAMDKKVNSKPMQRILGLLSRYEEMRIFVLCETAFMSLPVETWPVCPGVIAFHATGYPLEKVKAYIALRKPYTLNDVGLQGRMLDRREVYRVLQENDIPVPTHLIVNRTEGSRCDFEEKEDLISFNGQTMAKPFVEKPVSAENHDIYVYLHSSDGGGAQHLFRKQKDRSSEFLATCHNVRRDGSFIYENFMVTGGSDIKVYTVGPEYAHAEVRKSPVVDGKVLRDQSGKELRCPIVLNSAEKEIATKVVAAFQQNICGFDLLRTRSGSYVCDVNGWSFVKRSEKYYDDCAQLMRLMFLEAIDPAQLSGRPQTPLSLHDAPDGPTSRHASEAVIREDELRCVIAVVRHGDRTPKQKMKTVITDPAMLALFGVYSSDVKAELKLKTPKQLETVLQIAQSRLRNFQSECPPEMQDYAEKLCQVEDVLTRFPITGVNRKVQLKPLAYGTGPNGKQTVTEAQLVLKWGGELTSRGIEVAERFGQQFREAMYPRSGPVGLLRLHSTYRHDLKIYSSGEGRVQMTASAFAKGLLALEGDIRPIRVSLVRKDEAVDVLLDDSSAARAQLDSVKEALQSTLKANKSTAELVKILAPDATCASVAASLQKLGNLDEAMTKLLALVKDMTARLKELRPQYEGQGLYEVSHAPSSSESISLMIGRWEKLGKDFFSRKKKTFDVSKIPDIYDSVKYDALNNAAMDIPQRGELLALAKLLADVVVPQEYGITLDEKLSVARNIARPLMGKILADVQAAAHKKNTHVDFMDEVSHVVTHSRGDATMKIQNKLRKVRTRLYFSSESHLHSLLNIVRFGGLAAGLEGVVSPECAQNVDDLAQVTELNYLTHIVCRVFERALLPEDHPDRFYSEWYFSPGVNLEDGNAILPMKLLSKGRNMSQLEAFFQQNL